MQIIDQSYFIQGLRVPALNDGYYIVTREISAESCELYAKITHEEESTVAPNSNSDDKLVIIPAIRRIPYNKFTKSSVLSIPKTVNDKTIIGVGKYAFYNLEFGNIKLPDTIEYIDSHAFSGCSNLNEIEIPPKVTIIPSIAFENCFSLVKISVKGKIEKINPTAFEGCKDEILLYENSKSSNSPKISLLNTKVDVIYQ